MLRAIGLSDQSASASVRLSLGHNTTDGNVDEAVGIIRKALDEICRNGMTRSNEEMPELGVPFTAILTISDPDRQQSVFNDLRQSLLAYGVEIADIRTAARITQRI